MTPLPSRRSVLAGLPAAGVPLLAAASPSHARPAARPGSATMSWLGTAGWRVEAADRTVLVDPYLTRFDTGLAAGRFDAGTPLRTDPAAVDPHAAGADTVLVTHTHWDHFADVPHIARTTGAQVFGTLTTCQVARSSGVAAGQVSVLQGGEVLRLGDLLLRPVPARHSRNGRGAVLFPGVVPQPGPPPATIADLPEGETLGFCLELPTGARWLFLGASDFSEADLDGLAPDVVTVPVPSSDTTWRYVARLMEVLDRPRTVVPVHWDDFESPLAAPARPMDQATEVRLRTLVDEVRRASPGSRVVVPEYLTPIAPDRA